MLKVGRQPNINEKIINICYFHENNFFRFYQAISNFIYTDRPTFFTSQYYDFIKSNRGGKAAVITLKEPCQNNNTENFIQEIEIMENKMQI